MMKITNRQLRLLIKEAIRNIEKPEGDDINVGKYLSKEILDDEENFRSFFAPLALPIDVHIFNAGELLTPLDIMFVGTSRKGGKRAFFNHLSKNKIAQLWSLVTSVSEKATDRPWYRVDKAVRSQIEVVKRIWDIWKNADSGALTILLASPGALEAFDSSYGWLLHDVAGHSLDFGVGDIDGFVNFITAGRKGRNRWKVPDILRKYMDRPRPNAITGEIENEVTDLEAALQKDLDPLTPGVALYNDASASVFAFYLLKGDLPPSLYSFMSTEDVEAINAELKMVGEELKGKVVIAVQ